MAKMTEDELIALTDREINAAIGAFGTKLAEQRRKATAYYLAKPEGDLSPPEVEGRSSVVVPFVRNTIEAMLPQLMVKFTGGDNVVEFEPTKPGDEKKAELCTEYLNYLFWKRNRGHMIAETWMRDALLYKNGIAKIWWDTRVEEKKEEYRGLSQVELAEIMEDEEVEVTEGRSYPDEEEEKARQQAVEQMTAQMQQALAAAQQNPQAGAAVQQMQAQIQQIQAQPVPLLYDITAKRSKKAGKLALENVPPEEFLISRDAKSIQTASFVGHRVQRTLSELRSMGYKDLEDLQGDESYSWDAEAQERNNYEADGPYGDDVGDESQRRVWLTECYIRCDYDGDGIAELRKVCRAGNKVLDNEEVDEAPFVDLVCIRQPHKFSGLSIHDLGSEAQKTSTSILRSQLDNMYLQVNGRYFAEEGQVNLDDLLTSRPGGVVRIKRPGAVGRLDQAMGDSQAGMGMLEYMEGFGESATGWTRYSQGNAAGKLGQSTATGMNIIANRDDMRVDLIARNFAEGFVELFKMMLKLVCQHQDKKTEARLTGGWVDIDPREWKNQFDVNINVGLGVGNKDQQIQQILAVIAQQEKVHAIGVASPANIFNASAELAKLTGQKSGEKYFTDPSKQPPQPPRPDPEVVKGQVQAQLEQIKAQAQAALKDKELAAQMQLEREKMQLQAQVDANEQAAQQMQTTQQQQLQAELEREKAALEYQAEAARMQHELSIKQMEIESENARKAQDNEVKLAIAELQANVQAAGIQSTERQSEKDSQAKVAAAKTAAAAKPKPEKQAPEKPNPEIGEIKQLMTELHAQATAPKQVLRDAEGKAVAIKHGNNTRPIQRDGEGRITGV